MKALALLALLPLTGCAGLSDWLNAPADAPLAVEDPNTGASVEVTLPEGQDPEPIVIEDESGAAVTITPPGADPQTRGDVIARSVGNMVGTATGNPLLGLLAIGGLLAGSRALKGKKKGAA